MVKLSYNHLLFNTETNLNAPDMDLRLSPSESYRAIVLVIMVFSSFSVL